jgi:hypothetical protein
MLQAASMVVGQMPRLRLMEIWSGGRDHGAIFGYQRTGDFVAIWGEATCLLPWDPQVAEAWEKAVRLHTRHELRIIQAVNGGVISSHGDVIARLRLKDEVCKPVSLFQIQREGDIFYYP